MCGGWRATGTRGTAWSLSSPPCGTCSPSLARWWTVLASREISIAVLPVLFHLLWQHELAVDLSVPLHAASVVSREVG